MHSYTFNKFKDPECRISTRPTTSLAPKNEGTPCSSMEQPTKRRKTVQQQFRPKFYKMASREMIDVDKVSMHIMNDDCFLDIFSYCGVAEKFYLRCVCKRWFNLCMQSICATKQISSKILYKDLSHAIEYYGEDFCFKTIYDKHCSRIFPFMPGVRTADILSIFSMVGKNLVRLDILLEHHILHIGNLEVIADHCPNITVLAITEEATAHDLDPAIEEKYFEALSHRLRKLTLKSSLPFRGEFLGTVLKRAVQLETLDLSLPVKINNSRYRHGCVRFSSVVDGVFVLPQLPATAPMRVLNLSGCESFQTLPDPNWLDQFFNLDPCIRRWIDLMRTEEIGSTIELLLDQFSETIEYLNLSRINDVFHGISMSNQHGRKKCANLNKLVLQGPSTLYCMTIGIPSYEVDELFSALSLMPNLRTLDLTFNCNLERDPGILSKINEVAPCIEELILDNCRLFAKNLLCLSEFWHLRKLSINKPKSDAHNIYRENQFGYKYFAKEVLPGLRHLQDLSMRGTHGLHDQNIYRIIMNSSLRVITFDFFWSAERWNTLTKKCYENAIPGNGQYTQLRGLLTIELPNLPEELVLPLDCFIQFKCLKTGRLVYHRRNWDAILEIMNF